jgi:hypothetical protein
MTSMLFCRRITGRGLVLVAMLGWQGCSSCNVTLKTLDLSPSDFDTGTTGTAGSIGWCLSAGNPPPTSFAPGPGQVMVGFDDFFNPGSQPLPCNELRDANFRGGVAFDVSPFDQIVSADFLFSTDSSIGRSGGETTSQIPPKSVATTLGVGTAAFSPAMPDDNEAPLVASPVGVTSQVRDWVTGARPSFGFVLWGPRPPVNHSNPPQDNDAQVSWYSGFKLRIVYNPANNPRAPL